MDKKSNIWSIGQYSQVYQVRTPQRYGGDPPDGGIHPVVDHLSIGVHHRMNSQGDHRHIEDLLMVRANIIHPNHKDLDLRELLLITMKYPLTIDTNHWCTKPRKPTRKLFFREGTGEPRQRGKKHRKRGVQAGRSLQQKKKGRIEERIYNLSGTTLTREEVLTLYQGIKYAPRKGLNKFEKPTLKCKNS